jgi:hypothetical protein
VFVLRGIKLLLNLQVVVNVGLKVLRVLALHLPKKSGPMKDKTPL